MKSTLTKQQFIDQLTEALLESEARQVLIDAAKALIPSAFNQAQLTALHNSTHIQQAFLTYKALCPEADKSRASIDLVVAWLLDMGAVNYAANLEKKLTQVNKAVMAYGLISPFDKFTITGEDLIALRVYSSVDPVIKK
jgi:hypothetical protein